MADMERRDRHHVELRCMLGFITAYGVTLTCLYGASLAIPRAYRRQMIMVDHRNLHGLTELTDVESIQPNDEHSSVANFITLGILIGGLLCLLATIRRNYFLTVSLSHMTLLINLMLFVDNFENYHYRIFSFIANITTLTASVHAISSYASIAVGPGDF